MVSAASSTEHAPTVTASWPWHRCVVARTSPLKNSRWTSSSKYLISSIRLYSARARSSLQPTAACISCAPLSLRSCYRLVHGPPARRVEHGPGRERDVLAGQEGDQLRHLLRLRHPAHRH